MQQLAADCWKLGFAQPPLSALALQLELERSRNLELDRKGEHDIVLRKVLGLEEQFRFRRRLQESHI